MARNRKVAKKTSSRKPRPAEGKGGRVRRGRPKVCRLCADDAVWVDYKDVNLLGRFLNNRGRIKGRGTTGTCAQHQRDVAVAIKTARELALLPYVVLAQSTEANDRRGGRRGHDRAPVSAQAAVPQGADAEADSVDGDTPEGEGIDADGEMLQSTLESDTQPSAETHSVVATP